MRWKLSGSPELLAIYVGLVSPHLFIKLATPLGRKNADYMQFLLLNGAEDSYWRMVLAEALEPLGSLNVVRANQGLPLESREAESVIIIDATVVENVEKLVSSLRTESPQQRIVVVTASPTWQRARAAFESGAIDYLPKTLQPQELRNAFEQIIRRLLPPWPR